MTESLARLAEEDAKALTALAEEARGAPAGRDLSEAKTVTSEETAREFWLSYIESEKREYIDTRRALDAIRDRYARDHGLLTREEVERRARDWVAAHRSFGYGVESLVSALTRPAPGGPDGR